MCANCGEPIKLHARFYQVAKQGTGFCSKLCIHGAMNRKGLKAQVQMLRNILLAQKVGEEKNFEDTKKAQSAGTEKATDKNSITSIVSV